MRKLYRSAALALLVSLTVASPSSAEERAGTLQSSTAERLHKLAGDILPERSRLRSSRHDESRTLASALVTLSASVSEAQASPSGARLRKLGRSRRRAEAALTNLRDRMRAGGQSEDAADLGRLFEPLWNEIDEALTAPRNGRGEKLSKVQDRLRNARSNTATAHGTAFVAIPLSAPR